MGNALRRADDLTIRAALRHHAQHPDATVRETVAWALAQVPGQPA